MIPNEKNSLIFQSSNDQLLILNFFKSSKLIKYMNIFYI
jgi:hypothetical protein